MNTKQGNNPLWHGAGISSHINHSDYHVGAFRDSKQLPQIDSVYLQYLTNTIMQADDSLFTLKLQQQATIHALKVRADSHGQATVYEGSANNGQAQETLSYWIVPPSRAASIEQVLMPLMAEPLRHAVFISMAQQRGFVHHSLFTPNNGL